MPATPTTIETADLKAFIDARRPRAWALGYPGVVRERVRAYAAARRSAGATVGMIAEELGLSRHSGLAWTRGRREEVRLRPVVVTVPSRRFLPAGVPRSLPLRRRASVGECRFTIAELVARVGWDA